jgi:hypothetical protein
MAIRATTVASTGLLCPSNEPQDSIGAADRIECRRALAAGARLLPPSEYSTAFLGEHQNNVVVSPDATAA